jgi:hypothetical protein
MEMPVSNSVLSFFILASFVAFVAAAWGVIRPYRGLGRRWFALATVASFFVMLLVVPQQPQNAASAKNTSEPNSGVSSDQPAILAKVEEASHSWTEYTRSESPDVVKAVGPIAFKKLGKLEPGAFYATAESTNCDKVTSGAVSPDKSTKGAPVWLVDCDNGNRFVITAGEAADALKLKKTGALALNDVSASCTAENLEACVASDAQKSASQAEVVSACDTAVQQALIGDSSMDWHWDYAFEKGDTVQVVRGFKATNAFGAKLKHRYFCDFDTAKKEITRLSVEGPFGTKRLI